MRRPLLYAALVAFALFTGLPASSQGVPPYDVITLPSSNPDDNFGNAVNTDGTRVIIGVPRDDTRGTDAGATHIYRSSSSGWVLEASLRPSDGSAGFFAGVPVAIDGSWAFVGHRPANDSRGVVYVYQRSGTTWTLRQTLAPSNLQPGDRFGSHIRVDGSYVVLGADQRDTGGTGSAYVFRWNGSSWVEDRQLFASDGAPGDRFGFTVDIEGTTVVVGASGDDDGRGAAYVFDRSSGVWTQRAKLVSSARQPGDTPFSVAISGSWVMHGAVNNDAQGTDAGRVVVFQRTGSTWASWTERGALTASDATSGDVFGGSLAMDGDVAVIGATGNGSGALYVFDRSGTTWTERERIANLGFTGLGGATGLVGTTAVTGAGEHNGGRGAVLVFDLTEEEPPPPPPSEPIEITFPMGGEVFVAGQTIEITWDPGTVPASTPLRLNLRDGQGPNQVIAQDTPNDGSYTWQIPADQVNSSEYGIYLVYDPEEGTKVRVRSGFFTIGGGVEPGPIEVTSPVAGEVWTAGSTRTIRWSPGSVPPDTPIRITLRDGSGPNQVIANATENDGEFAWVVPSSQTSSTEYRVFLVYDDPNTGDKVKAKSDAFEIAGGGAAGPIVVTAPTEGETLAAGQTYTIQWDPGSVPASTPLRITLRDGSGPNQVLVDPTPNDGSFVWDVPSGQTPSTEYQLYLVYDDPDTGQKEKARSRPFEITSSSPFGKTGSLSRATLAPNPFRGSTTVTFKLAEVSDIEVAVFDVQGREVARLAEGVYETGIHSVRWDAADVAPGVYLVRFTTGDGTRVQRALVTR